MQSDLTCHTCRHTSETVDPFWDVSVDLVSSDGTDKASDSASVCSSLSAESDPSEEDSSGSVTLEECLDRFTRSERLGAEAKIRCSNCGIPQEGTKRLSLKRVPIVVCIHVKRFRHSKKTRKLSNPLEFPFELDLSPYLTSSIRNPKQSTRHSSHFVHIPHILSTLLTFCPHSLHFVNTPHILSTLLTFCPHSSHSVHTPYILSPLLTFCPHFSHFVHTPHILSTLLTFCSHSSHFVHTPHILSTLLTQITEEVGLYRLFAVVNHMGTYDSGHYINYILHAGEQWFRCDDTYLTSVPKETVKNSEAYMLFYQKKVIEYL
eukprot:sb/3466889/